MKRTDENAGHRHERLEETILEELRALFRDDVSDPALADVAIARVVLSVDYRHVRAHYVVRAGAPSRVVEQRLARAAPFLRTRLAESIDFKRVPEIGFVLDGEAADAPAEDRADDARSPRRGRDSKGEAGE